MSFEDDAERIGQEIKKAMSSTMATQPDVLVFMLRGSEIRDIMNEMADDAEKTVSELESDSKVTPIRRPARALPMPPGYPPFAAGHEGPPPEMIEEQKRRNVQVLRRHARNCRFLATHIEEDRFFRLASHDLAFLGLVNVVHGPHALGGVGYG